MSLFKHAYVRGINDELVRLGYVRYPTKEAADAVADAVADQALPQEPAATPVSPETAADVAATLVDAANKLVEETGMAEQPAAAPEEALKTSAAEDLNTRAVKQAEAVMVKAANEKRAEGSTYVGGDKGNDPAQAAQTDAAAQLDHQLRPEGYAHQGVAGVGQTDTQIGRDASTQVGREEPHPVAPGASPAGSNTVIEQSKGASLREIIRKVAAEGSNYTGGDKGNTPAQAAQTDFTARLDQQQRPEGYAEGARGQGWGSVPNTALIGTEQPHPKTPGETPGGSNSVTQASKMGSEDPFLSLFKKTAEEVAPHLPGNMGEDEKIAHIRRLMGLSDSERTEYIAMLHKDAGASDDQAIAVAQKHAECSKERRRYSGNPNRMDRTRANQKTAQELPPALAAVVEAKKDEKKNGNGDAKKEDESAAHEAKEPAGHEQKEKEGEGERKEGQDLLSRIRRIAQSGASARA